MIVIEEFPSAMIIGEYPINAVWTSEIKPELKRILYKEHIDWLFFTAVRVGYGAMPKHDCPVTVLIFVRENAVTPDHAVRILETVADCVYR